MSGSERRKGAGGELEVARIFQAAGYRCNFDLAGEDPDGDARERAVEAAESESERTER